MKRVFITLLFAALLCSCQKELSVSGGPVEVALCAAVETPVLHTKAPFELSVPTTENPVTAAIWASTTSQNYKGSQTSEPGPDATVIDYHNSTCFTSGAKQLLDHQLFYPENKSYVYFVGLCPRSEGGWQVYEETDGSGKWNVAHHAFDGKTDVMYASEVKNNIESSISPRLDFRHVLTWIRFNVVADSQDAIDAWGKLKKITVDSNKEIYINLTYNTCRFDNEDPDFQTYCTNKGVYTDIPFSGQAIELTTSEQEVAYILCAAVVADPADGANEFSITIDTEYRPDTKVSINLKNAQGGNFSGNTEGCQFTATLRFKLGDNIVTTARATEWVNGGIGVSQVGE